MEIVGKAPIEKTFYITGKFSMFLVIIAPAVAYFYKPMVQMRNDITVTIAFTAFAVSMVLLFISYLELGNSTRMGLPSGKTKLKTKGIYRFSRNPMYMGLFCLCLSSVFYTANIFVLALTIYSVWVHHRIVLGEEKFLAKRFGIQWVRYRSKVRRYF